MAAITVYSCGNVCVQAGKKWKSRSEK